MDTIFHETTGYFQVVSQAKHQPRRYGKNGELLINYEETEEHRRSSIAPGAMQAAAALHKRGQTEKGVDGVDGVDGAEHIDKKED